jgi:hypothetical protein
MIMYHLAPVLYIFSGVAHIPRLSLIIVGGTSAQSQTGSIHYKLAASRHRPERNIFTAYRANTHIRAPITTVNVLTVVPNAYRQSCILKGRTLRRRIIHYDNFQIRVCFALHSRSHA